MALKWTGNDYSTNLICDGGRLVELKIPVRQIEYHADGRIVVLKMAGNLV